MESLISVLISHSIWHWNSVQLPYFELQKLLRKKSFDLFFDYGESKKELFDEINEETETQWP